ncbi:aquaporin Z [Halomonas elongata]|uniref:aquaporin Z n=1 Tax=Halomonas elongata TaxID=2746 RepID=UPI0023B1B846|nr:aquaporin Z [Halomonas elongata]
MHRYIAEFIGTFWLVLAGCGSAILTAGLPGTGINLLIVALAFGLATITMGFAIGHISGCHLNPAVSIGLWAGGRFSARELPYYIGSQIFGALIAAGVLYLIASGKPGFDFSNGFAANGYGKHSPGGYDVISALLTEIVMAMIFLFVILGATDARAPRHAAPLASGLCLALIYLVSLPITNGSINPARSTGIALLVGDWALVQLWLFWVAPILGGLLGAILYRMVSGTWRDQEEDDRRRQLENNSNHVV